MCGQGRAFLEDAIALRLEGWEGTIYIKNASEIITWVKALGEKESLWDI